MKRLLIAGFGDIARRALPLLEQRFAVLRLARRYGFDLDQPDSLVLPRVDAGRSEPWAAMLSRHR